MSRNRRKSKGRRESGPFIAVPIAVIESKEYAALRASEVKLIIDLHAQYRGFNNGDLQLTWGEMSNRGWASRETLDNARRRLLERGFIILTRQGGRHCPSLYALSYLPINECGGKLDVSSTPVAPATWRARSVPRDPCQIDPKVGPMMGKQGG
ncbi:MAG: hypothetical protein AB7Q97_12455 [Gammaproteobacteria bacterium]